MIIRPGIRQISDSIRACGFDDFYEFGALEPAVIGEHEIVSLFWRDHSYAQLIARAAAPRDLFERITIHLPKRKWTLDRDEARVFSPTIHGDTNWLWMMEGPGFYSGSDFIVEVE